MSENDLDRNPFPQTDIPGEGRDDSPSPIEGADIAPEGAGDDLAGAESALGHDGHDYDTLDDFGYDSGDADAAADAVDVMGEATFVPLAGPDAFDDAFSARNTYDEVNGAASLGEMVDQADYRTPPLATPDLSPAADVTFVASGADASYGDVVSSQDTTGAMFEGEDQPLTPDPSLDYTIDPDVDTDIELASDEQAALDALLAEDNVTEVDAPPEEALTGTFTPTFADHDGEEIDLVGEGDDQDAPFRASDHIEAAALGYGANPSQTLPFTPVAPTPREGTSSSGRISGSGRATGALVWGSRTDVGHVREHNEDSYLVNFPLFAVADGMGGHAAGEIASTIAVSSLSESGLTKADPYALGAAVEQANRDVLDGARAGMGRAGMGTTCTAILIEGNRMAVGHVGDSRAYLMHAGKLLRVTHDHSFVEELVEAGEITAEEARVHPSRSIITRALGSDPNMRADAFMIDITRGDRVMLCSDGLSSMVCDRAIEEAMASAPTPQACADRLVNLALDAGGGDNVSVIVVDVNDDGIERHALRNRIRNVLGWLAAVLLVFALIGVGLSTFSQNTWYLKDSNGYVALYHGLPFHMGPFDMSELVEVTTIQVADLNVSAEQRLTKDVITCRSEDEARLIIERFRGQLTNDAGSGAETGADTGIDSGEDGRTALVMRISDQVIAGIEPASSTDGSSTGAPDGTDDAATGAPGSSASASGPSAAEAAAQGR